MAPGFHVVVRAGHDADAGGRRALAGLLSPRRNIVGLAGGAGRSRFGHPGTVLARGKAKNPPCGNPPPGPQAGRRTATGPQAPGEVVRADGRARRQIGPLCLTLVTAWLPAPVAGVPVRTVAKPLNRLSMSEVLLARKAEAHLGEGSPR